LFDENKILPSSRTNIIEAMCWDVSLHTDIDAVKKAFPKVLIDARDKQDTDAKTYEQVQAMVFPTYPVIITADQAQQAQLVDMQWGVLPFYLHDPAEQVKRRLQMINIRSERILDDQRSYWYRIREQHCLIPVTGTYEHRKIAGWSKKVPYWIGQEGREVFFMPGLYQIHQQIDKDTGEIVQHRSFGLITRSANELMAGIHNDGPNKHRMPLYLPADLEQQWLFQTDPSTTAQILSFEMPSEQLNTHPVFTLRGYPVRPDGLPRDAPFQWPQLPPLNLPPKSPIQGSLF
jgi:putative SOS response-associated peptidase YedK